MIETTRKWEMIDFTGAIYMNNRGGPSIDPLGHI